MSVFDLPQELTSLNMGVSKYTTVQMYPTSSSINAETNIGTGSAAGNMVFEWAENSEWWSPANSYFEIQCEFTGIETGNPKSIAYCDNFCSTLFNNVQIMVDNKTIESVNQPWVPDTVGTYTGAKQTWLQTCGSVAAINVPFVKRLNETYNTTANASNVLKFCFRPALGVFSCQLLPPGARWRTVLQWATNGQACIESLLQSTTPAHFILQIKSFSFYKCTLKPDPSVALPPSGFLDLYCMGVQQYATSLASTANINFTCPKTTNKIYVTFQDNNFTGVTSINPTPLAITAAGANGIYPITSFVPAVTGGLNEFSAYVSQLYIKIDGMNETMPSPYYTLDSTGVDWDRAYTDFLNVSQGASDNNNGNIPFGTFDISSNHVNQVIIQNGAATGNIFSYNGDPRNEQQIPIYKITTAAGVLQKENDRTARYGWLGRIPGPIFAFPIIRDGNRSISGGTINAKFSTAANSVLINMVFAYTLALAFQQKPDGTYMYTLIEE